MKNNTKNKEKLDSQSSNLINKNFELISELFPNCITESLDGQSIDFELLKQELSKDIVEGNKERYRLEWPGKREAILSANSPTNKTLRPIRDDSVNFDTTENLYIEGDNLEVLKILQESYLSKIKLIYIDPPYNTGKDFVYKDNFNIDAEEELIDSGQKNEYNERLVSNPDTAGRYHSDWLSMMYPRLKLARNLMTDDGIIFISIDDNEIHNLRKICDEIFGTDNFIANTVRRRRLSQANLTKNISTIHEYILIYSKSSKTVLNKIKPKIDESEYKNPDNDPRGPYVTMPCTNKGGAKYTITTTSGKKIEEEWRFKKETYKNLEAENRIFFPRNGEGKPRYKIFLKEKKEKGVLPNTWWDSISSNQEATTELKKLFDDKLYFDFPKPVDLIQFIVELSTNKEDIVLDFFSGSSTTAHAVMNCNSVDKGNRKFIMVQLPEKIEENLIAYKDGYKNISQISKERIRRSGRKIKNETNAKIDYGFRVYQLDSSNMEETNLKIQDYNQSELDLLENNIKPDRTDNDLLTQLILNWGLPLSLKIESFEVEAKLVYKVANLLYACFDDDLDEKFAKTIAKEKPLRIVFKDSSFKNDNAKSNVKQLLKQLSPETEMKVI
tara:strand:+ start:561 stop:2396 length:1836 start_codon:yes stop_codon:yes gene_type:complete